jgi:hypothetical protein
LIKHFIRQRNIVHSLVTVDYCWFDLCVDV